jgi:hypothetical protein
VTEKTSTISYSASLGTASFGALTINEWAVLIGLVFTVATFGVNYLFQRRRDKREQALFEHAIGEDK